MAENLGRGFGRYDAWMVSHGALWDGVPRCTGGWCPEMHLGMVSQGALWDGALLALAVR